MHLERMYWLSAGIVPQRLLSAPAYVRVRQHASACVSIRQHTSACVSMRQHASAYVSMRQHASACVSIRQHSSHTHTHTHTHTHLVLLDGPAAVILLYYLGSTCLAKELQYIYSIRQHTSAYVSIRQHTPAHVSIAYWRYCFCRILAAHTCPGQRGRTKGKQRLLRQYKRSAAEESSAFCASICTFVLAQKHQNLYFCTGAFCASTFVLAPSAPVQTQRLLRHNSAGQRGAVFCTASLAFVQKQRLLRQYLYFCTKRLLS
jgi:hypothetical protein